MQDSQFSAALFQVEFFPDQRLVHWDINGVSSIDNRNVTATVQLFAYGFEAIKQEFNPCDFDLKGMCPMQEGNLDLSSDITDIDPQVISKIPSIAFQVPDLDGRVRVTVKDAETGEQVACLEATLSNLKTVDQKPVGFLTAVIAGMGLIASAVTSGLGHDNTAAHVAANALSLFGYFQAQAMVAMTAVPLPPIVASWTQNFDWCMGIIHIDFIQRILHWYIVATGGTPTNLLNNLERVSVHIQKRDLMKQSFEYGGRMVARGLNHLQARSNNDYISNEPERIVSLSGIERVSFKSKIEETNFFLTGLAFFIAFVLMVNLGVAAFKGFCEVAVKMKWMHYTKFQQFRNGWLTVLKGIMYRLILIGFPQMSTLCLWELTVRDSVACVILALFFFIVMTAVLCWAAFKVIKIAKKSVNMHKNPAYILYADPSALNRWGFLYIQFRATAYYFIIPLMGYVLIKAIFIAFGQGNGTMQAFALLIIELAYLVGVCMLKPWMDKKTNIFNISICSINLLNTIFLVIFTGVFKFPPLVVGVMGVVFFVINAIFSLVLLILVAVASVYALASKNPETRYQPMRDDRSSFIKSNSQMISSTELDALGATARGDSKEGYNKRRDLDDDGESFTSKDAYATPLPPSSHSAQAPVYRENGPSPVDPSVPYFPSNRSDSSYRPGGSPPK
ncbi:MAG: hypothetical protein L6R37_002175 [Teloschistes peruensis]|nr:MAG: hypothetical protein L6R37_002175 [Teloschistes peruensis]